MISRIKAGPRDLSLYKKVRPEIRTGDCVLWKGKSLLARAVSLWSEYTHASMIVRFDKYKELLDRVFLVESLVTGAEMRLLSWRLEDAKGQAWIYQPAGLSGEMRNQVREQALMMTARAVRYDYAGLFKNILGRVSEDANRVFCSELVGILWEECGLKRKKGAPKGIAPRPVDLTTWWQGKKIQVLL